MSQTQVETKQFARIPQYVQVAETTHDRKQTCVQRECKRRTNAQSVDWADLITLDLSTFDTPGGKEKLASQLSDAINKIGFFYITNFGLSQEEVDQQFAIGKELYTLPTEELLKYRADLENGGYNGYRPMGLRELAPGIFDVSPSGNKILSLSSNLRQ